MKMKSLGALAVLGLASTVALSATSDKTLNKRIAAAAVVLDELRATPDQDIPKDLWDKAECVVVIPSVKKAAFIIGGEYGKGLVSCRKDGAWGNPAFMLLEKGSWGFQIGGQTVDLVLLVMNEHGMKSLLESKVALGGDVSVAGGPVGRDARAATDIQLKAEILSYSRTQGLFAGIDISGGILKADDEDNADLYGRKVTGHELLIGSRMTTPKMARPFMAALGRMSAAPMKSDLQ